MHGEAQGWRRGTQLVADEIVDGADVFDAASPTSSISSSEETKAAAIPSKGWRKQLELEVVARRVHPSLLLLVHSLQVHVAMRKWKSVSCWWKRARREHKGVFGELEQRARTQEM
ncbi:hypothetical protein ACFX2C_035389 [Malus domestica]